MSDVMGRHSMVCDKCDGTGKAKCQACSGKGYVDDIKPVKLECLYCKGKGFLVEDLDDDRA